MKIEIGNYVRYKRGYNDYGIEPPERIAKVIDRINNSDILQLDVKQDILESDVIKASDKLIDILNVGDFLDNHCIVEIRENTCYMNDGWFINRNDIEDLVTFICTKEQFEKMAYKVGD